MSITGLPGADVMMGALGDDTYFVDNAGDAVIESPGGGNDTVFSTAHYRLGANVENLTLQGSTDLQGYGNSLANSIVGNAGSNILGGGAGSDILTGGPGADKFVFDATALTPAQPGAAIFDRIVDYDQGNSGRFNLAEGDTFDFSALLSAGKGQSVSNLVRVLESPSGTAAILQIDQDGTANGAHWTTIAPLLKTGLERRVSYPVFFSRAQRS
jgi:Ca2+-binding RTX toxin-like protein